MATSGAAMVGEMPGEESAAVVVQNNSTATEVPPHENPQEADGEGDQDRVAAYLADRLEQRMGDSLIRIEEGEYEQGRALLGDEYDDTLEKYVEVASDTGNEETATELENVRDDQQDFAEKLEEYEETRKAYEQALEDGDEERARELARELVAQAEEINATGSKLEGHYERLENITGENFTQQKRVVGSITQNVSSKASEIRTAQFVGTNLSVTAFAQTASFRDPVTVTGRLRTDENGPIANETVQLTVNEQKYSVTTDSNGTFSLTYRPVEQALDASSVTVAFRPAPNSEYLPAETDLTVAIGEQTASSINVTTASELAQFRDVVRASGTVTVAENATVAGIPVELAIDGRTLATGVTNADGTYDLSGTLPATVDAGEGNLTVSVALENAAVASSTATTAVTVDSTPTTLSLEGDPAAGAVDRVLLTGTLLTAPGGVLPGRSLAVRLEGDRIGTVRVAEDGSFRATVTIPETHHDAETVRLSVFFDGTGTNLDSTRAEVEVVVPSALGASEAETPGLGALILRTVTGPIGTALGVGLLALTAVALARPEWAGSWPLVGPLVGRLLASDEPPAEASRTGDSDGDESGTTTGLGPGEPLLDRARTALANGDPAGAIEASYAAVRTALTESTATDVDVPESATHWEFYRASLDSGVEADGSLETITEAFERAAFAADDVEEEDAEDVLQRARELL